MATLLNAYLSFKDNAREAMEFYRGVFGGKLDINTFGEMGDEASKDLIMHSQLTAPNGFTLMGSDTPPGTEYRPAGNISLSLSGTDEAELRGYWDKLSEGGMVVMPLEKAPWGDTFGMFQDRYGIAWMVNVTQA